MVNFIGTGAGEALSGTSGRDRINGKGGDDTLSGLGGNDKIRGGSGDNVIDGGSGHDRLTAGDGNNTILGGSGHDVIGVGDGNNLIDGGSGHDQIFAGDGDNTISGGSGNDFIWVDDGDNSIDGGLGRDVIRADRGDDTVQGGAGSDFVSLGRGDDTAVYNMSVNSGASDKYLGGWGQDTLILEFTDAEWAQADVQADIAAFYDFLNDGGETQGWCYGHWFSSDRFSFTAFNLNVYSFETLRVFVDGVEVTPGNNPVIASDDLIGVQEDMSVSGNVLDNDTALDGIQNVVLIDDADRGSLTLDSDGSFTFSTDDAFDDLAEGEVATETFVYEITDTDGETDQATVTVTVTGTNDGPTLAVGSVAAAEDGAAVSVDLSALGADVDSDDDGSTLSYEITGLVAEGMASIVGSDLSFDPGSDFQDLAAGETRDVVIQVRATDAHGAMAVNDVTVTVTGTNDGPTLAVGSLAAAEDGAAVSVDLSALGADVDSDDDGSTLSYEITGLVAEGTASIVGSDLSFDPGSDFQDLA
ncbi:Ig-like domain-containing protein, partial [uncultured Pelagimonas sp.]|uniref:Ig-like domain-containing protein n=1 Tax=uncultured Pelagimonas sp. TaxID=1618102 RepID=UPI00261A8921